MIKVNVMDKVKINMDIKDRITVIDGDSATGKTFMIKLINTLKNRNMESSVEGFPLSKMMPCKGELETLDAIKKADYGSIFIIDRYDVFSEETKKIIQDRIDRSKDTWIIMSRNCDIKSNESRLMQLSKVINSDGTVEISFIPYAYRRRKPKK